MKWFMPPTSKDISAVLSKFFHTGESVWIIGERETIRGKNQANDPIVFAVLFCLNFFFVKLMVSSIEISFKTVWPKRKIIDPSKISKKLSNAFIQ